MNNEHNPIAQRIHYLQDFWNQQRALKPKAQFIRWLIEEEDLPLVNGFYKLESSPYGKIQEALVVMLTNFETIDTFSYQLANHWLLTFKKEVEKYPALQWDEFNALETKFKNIAVSDTSQADAFLVTLLKKFKVFHGQPTNMYLGINPRNVSNYPMLCRWICNLLNALPENIGIVVTDYKKEVLFEPVFKNERARFIKQSLRLKDQGINKAYTELMTQGNPHDPQVAFRKCMVQMSEATKQENKEKLIKWGEKGLEIAKNTNDLSFWASAHLIYSGFLFGFKDHDRIKEVLDKGITISEKEPNDTNLQEVALQLYGYRASYYSFINQPKQAKEWFVKQALLAKEYQQPLVALTAYKNAFLVLEQNKKTSEIQELAAQAYTFCATIEDTILKTTEFPYIAKHYIDLLRRKSSTEESRDTIQEVNQYLTDLFGNDWEVSAKEAIKKISPIQQEIVTT